jgi:hypothetical protein
LPLAGLRAFSDTAANFVTKKLEHPKEFKRLSCLFMTEKQASDQNNFLIVKVQITFVKKLFMNEPIPMNVTQFRFNYIIILVFLFLRQGSLLLHSQDCEPIDLSKKKKLQMTSLAYGGTGVLLTDVNNQFTIMTGGRGSATYNHRFTFGGGGWGMPKGIELHTENTDTFSFFKFGYGGLEFGYIFFERQRVKFGSNILLACGVGFQETYPKSSSEIRMFPVFEPSLYYQTPLGKLLKADIGVTYRFVSGSTFSFINNRQLSGPSLYIAFLVGTCNCN